MKAARRVRAAPLVVEVSPGELIDKLTILEIKCERIVDPAKLANVRAELDMLEAARRRSLPESPELDRLQAELKTVNQRLWTIEDLIRSCEREREFGHTFIELARSVYRTNDRRALVKRAINDRFGSAIVEEKSYQAYG
ncbi:MAG: DUF6165 family protein [Alphaproteobacteria bacterium]